MWARQKSRSAWEDFKLSEFLNLSPDVKDLLKTVPKTRTVAELEIQFGLDAIMIPCWACLFHAVPETKRSVFEHADSRLLWSVMATRQKHGGHEPSLRILAEGMKPKA